MLINRLLNTDSKKLALQYQGKQWTYGTLITEIKKRQSSLKKYSAQLLLASDSPIENLLNLLTAISLGKKSVLAGKDFSEELLQKYCKKHNLELIVNIEKENDFLGPVSINKISHEDIFLGVLSSGSSGESKIIWKDYQSWFSAFPYQSSVFGINENDTVFVVDALSYSANLNSVLHTLWLGASLIIDKLQNASNWDYLWQKTAVSSLFLVPSHLRLISEKNFQNSQIKSIVTAGEKLSTKLAAKIFEKYPDALVTEYYGAAELGHISYIQGKDLLTCNGSVGEAFPEVKISIKHNKIYVESPFVSPAYRNGSTTVGDYGILDENGHLHLLGREGRMFNRRGLNIFAQEIENASLEHPLITEAVAIEVNDTILLYLTKKDPTSNIDFRTYLLKKLPPQKLPNRIIFLNKIPQNSSGKVDYRALTKIPVTEDESELIGLN